MSRPCRCLRKAVVGRITAGVWSADKMLKPSPVGPPSLKPSIAVVTPKICCYHTTHRSQTS
jgi:hypothetical protein